MTERLFLALWPPENVLDEIDRALPRGLTALRWQPRERWHVTVAFLGNREPHKELARLEQLEAIEPEPMHLAGSGAFGPVLWIGVQTGPWLAQLATDARRIFHVEERRFRAHVTVARARDSAGRRELLQAQETLSDWASTAGLPEALTLVRSTTGPRPSYEVIGRKGLGVP